MNLEKENFIEEFKKRTKQFTIDIISFVDTLIKTKASSVVTYQLLKSAGSVGANYRAACRSRSKKEFYSKICIVVEEADESFFWIEIINEAKLSENKSEINRLLKEAEEILKVMSKAKKSLYSN
jgi:four helix bundle protein